MAVEINYERAKEHMETMLTSVTGQGIYYPPFEVYERCIEALNKQIPKKPDTSDTHFISCPVCGNWIIDTEEEDGNYEFMWKDEDGNHHKGSSWCKDHEYERPPHCDNCGQKLDWSEE